MTGGWIQSEAAFRRHTVSMLLLTGSMEPFLFYMLFSCVLPLSKMFPTKFKFREICQRFIQSPVSDIQANSSQRVRKEVSKRDET